MAPNREVRLPATSTCAGPVNGAPGSPGKEVFFDPAAAETFFFLPRSQEIYSSAPDSESDEAEREDTAMEALLKSRQRTRAVRMVFGRPIPDSSSSESE